MRALHTGTRRENAGIREREEENTRPCTQCKSSRTCICRALVQMLKAVMHKVEDAIVGPFMRGDSFSLADVAAAPFFQVS